MFQWQGGSQLTLSSHLSRNYSLANKYLIFFPVQVQVIFLKQKLHMHINNLMHEL